MLDEINMKIRLENFLKAHNAYEDFISNMIECTGKSLDDLFNETKEPESLILNAFPWPMARNKSELWADLDFEWNLLIIKDRGGKTII